MASASGFTKSDFTAQFDKESQRWFNSMSSQAKPIIVKNIAQGVQVLSAVLERKTKIELSSGRIRVITGRLLNSIRYSLFNNRQSSRITANVEYAKFVHDGTRFMKSRPFFDWAVDNSYGEIKQVADQLGKDIAIGIVRA